MSVCVDNNVLTKIIQVARPDKLPDRSRKCSKCGSIGSSEEEILKDKGPELKEDKSVLLHSKAKVYRI